MIASLAAVWLYASTAASGVPPWPGNGPLWYPNEHPFHSIFLEQPLLDPVLPRRPRLEVHVSQASTMAFSRNLRESPAYDALRSNYLLGLPQTRIDPALFNAWAAANPSSTYLFADTETTRLSLAATLPFGRRTGVRVELPLRAQWGGLLDEVIKGWHRMLGFQQLGRGYAPAGQTQLLAAHGGETLYFGGSDSLDLGDLVVRGLYAPLTETAGRPAVLLAASLKAPTGAVSHVAGSGSWEGGLSVSAAKSFGAFRTYLGGGYTWHSRWTALPSLPIKDTVDLHAGLEMRVDSRWSWQAQVSAEGQALGRAEPRTFGRGAWRLGLAAHYRVGRQATVEWSFSENLSEQADTDDLRIQTGVRLGGF